MTTEGFEEECDVIRCDEVVARYVGNRGSVVHYVDHAVDNVQSAPNIIFDKQWKNIDGNYLLGKMNGFYLSDIVDEYTMNVDFYFVAPFDGIFGFITTGGSSIMRTSSTDITVGGLWSFIDGVKKELSSISDNECLEQDSGIGGKFHTFYSSYILSDLWHAHQIKNYNTTIIGKSSLG